ncbi:hypothetical protein Csa_005404 [Cucumis sativus]|nr:hypothetical protein Csa_005404 [Cucumis sativus]
MAEKGSSSPLPKFGEWDVNDPASAEGFTVIFNKARNEKKTGGMPDSPAKDETAFKNGSVLGKSQPVSSCSQMLRIYLISFEIAWNWKLCLLDYWRVYLFRYLLLSF